MRVNAFSLVSWVMWLSTTGFLFGGDVCAQRARQRAATAQVPIEISARPNTERVGVGDVFQLDVELVLHAKGQPDELVLPDLSDFKVVRSQRGPTSSSTTLINGSMSVRQSFSFTYLLRAETAGKKLIGSARARLGTHSVSTRPITIEVFEKKTGDGVSRSSDLDPSLRFTADEELPDFFLDVRFDRDQVYVGEQAQLSIQIFARDQVDIDIRELKPPKPPGFWVEVLESPSRVRPTRRSLRGQDFLVYPLMRLALFPLEAKEHTIEPFTMVVTAARNGFWGRGQDHPLTSETVKLVALALPQEGRPANFQPGNVGRFSLQATVDKAEIPLGQPAVLRVSVRGEGNASALQLPDIASQIDGARIFPPTQNETKSVHDGRVWGEKSVELLVQPNREGLFHFPAFSFSYFDPIAKRYAESRAKPLTLRVVPSSMTAAGGSATEIARGARPIERGLDRRTPGLLSSTPMFGSALFGAGLVGVMLAVVGRRRQRSLRSRTGQLQRARRRRKKDWRVAMEQKDLTALEKLLLEALAEQVGSEVRGWPYEQIEPELLARSVASDLARRLGNFFVDTQNARYVPKGGADRGRLFAVAETLLDELDSIRGAS